MKKTLVVMVLILMLLVIGCSTGEPLTGNQVTVVYTGNVTGVTGTAPIASSSGVVPNITLVIDASSLEVVGGQLRIKSGTYATLIGAEELTNKTLTSSVGKGTWTNSGNWVIDNVSRQGIGVNAHNTIPLDIFGGTGGIGQIRLTDIITNGMYKDAKIVLRHNLSAEEDIMLFEVGSSTQNYVILGGGSSLQNSATVIGLYNADNQTTTTGTCRLWLLGSIADWSNTTHTNLKLSGDMVANTNGTINLGGATGYFNDISYKTLTDRGCLGSFDSGVEMTDGRWLTDVESLKAIKIDSTKNTIYGVPMFDYSTMPKAVYKPALIAEKDVYEQIASPDILTGEIKYTDEKLLYKTGEKIGSDGAETTALISIMIGAIKEQAIQIEDLQKRLSILEALIK